MREIMFRGKAKRGGKWHYGYFKKEVDSSCWIRERIQETHYADYEVDSETVGQFVLENKRNNVRFYEDDIISWIDKSGYINKDYIGYDKQGCFHPFSCFTFYTNDVKLLGNRHDNPELLTILPSE